MVKNLKEWFSIRPAISVRMIEIEAGIPLTSLDKYLRGVRPFPAKYDAALIEVLKRYGYK